MFDKTAARYQNPKIVDMALIGVVDEYKNKGIAAALVSVFSERMANFGVEYAETNLMLEYNSPIQNLWKHFDTELHKRRRCFIKKYSNISERINARLISLQK